MFWKKLSEQTRTLLYSVFVLALTVGALLYGANYRTADASTAAAATTTAAVMAPAATFSADAPSLGAIPDGSGATTCGAFGSNRDVTFTVSGMNAPLSEVAVSMTGTHTWIGDLDAQLISPGSVATALLFRNVGAATATACGSSADFGGPYSFTDTAAASPTFWTTPGAAGTFRATAALTGAVTTITPAFAGLTSPQTNGTWTLRVRDGGVGDTGSITAATLTLTGAAVAKAVVDFNGDGKTDASVVRNTGGGPGGQVTWYNCFTGIAEPTCWQFVQWGLATDFFTPVDFDGDNKADISVWRPGVPGVAAFYILNSSTNTLTTDVFGQTGDDPTVVGDYTGDGKADRAVYRGGASSGLPSFWYFRASSANAGYAVNDIVYNQWGQNGDFPAPGDYDGNGRADFCVQRNGGGGVAVFYQYGNGTGVITQTWFGAPTDVIVPGDYDGDGKTDIATIRGGGGNILWFVNPSSAPATPNGNFTGFFATFGLSATDYPVQGDYNGDGKTDVAIWRPNASTVDNYFWVRATGTGAVTYQEWGQNGDYPAASYNTH